MAINFSKGPHFYRLLRGSTTVVVVQIKLEKAAINIKPKKKTFICKSGKGILSTSKSLGTTPLTHYNTGVRGEHMYLKLS